MHIAHHFFKREQHRRDGRVEGRGQSRRSACGHQRLDAAGSQPEPAAEH
jgi:hypothetical protein